MEQVLYGEQQILIGVRNWGLLRFAMNKKSYLGRVSMILVG